MTALAPASSSTVLSKASTREPAMNKLQTLLIYGAMAVGLVTVQSGAALANVENIVLVHGANVDGST
jgi:hypothetical protein